MQGAKHCRLVANGTDALEISLRCLGVGKNDLVGIPGITFYATAEAVINIGATPILIDVDPTTGLICVNSLTNILKLHPLKAVIPVHIYGLPAPMEKIEPICLDNNVAIVEDGAQASGTFTHTGPVGSGQNSLTTFSFYPTKNLSAMGDAGAILTQSDEMAEKIKVLRNHGRGANDVIGRNSRCDHFQAAILHLKLQEIATQNQFRKDIASQYFKYLNNSHIKLLDQKFLKTSSWHLFPVRLSDSKACQKLKKWLDSNEIGNSPFFYDKAMGQMPALKNCPGESKFSEQFAGTILSLPINPYLTKEQVQFVAETINSFEL